MLIHIPILSKIPDILINAKGYYVAIIGITGKHEFVNPNFANIFSTNNESLLGNFTTTPFMKKTCPY